MSARPVVDLPQPDSPTSPSVSPLRTSRLTSDTAWTLSPVRPTGNSTTRCSARSSVSSSGRRCATPLPAIVVSLVPQRGPEARLARAALVVGLGDDAHPQRDLGRRRARPDTDADRLVAGPVLARLGRAHR